MFLFSVEGEYGSVGYVLGSVGLDCVSKSPQWFGLEKNILALQSFGS